MLIYKSLQRWIKFEEDVEEGGGRWSKVKFLYSFFKPVLYLSFDLVFKKIASRIHDLFAFSIRVKKPSFKRRRYP